MRPGSASSWPLLGCGAGLRAEHYEKVLSDRPAIDWFEATSENYMTSGGRPLWVLEQVRRNYPVVLHGVSLSIGSIDPLDPEYLRRLKTLVDRIEPAIVSDHLCWAAVEHKNLHDLLPLPFTEEALAHIAARVEQVQDFLGRPILLENVSSYITFKHSVMTEWEFLSEVSRRSGCGILLDINNIYVNAVNHGFDPMDFIGGVPAAAVGYCHLAGHTDMGKWLFDTHSRPVADPVWALYKEALTRFGKKSTLIEWDEDIPDWNGLNEEVVRAKKIYLTIPDVVPADPKGMRGTGRPHLPPAGGGSSVSLTQVQRWMRRRIYPELTESGSADERRVELNDQGGGPGEDRLQVYADGYPARVAEALKETYEAVKHVLGEGMFLRVASDYADTRPSTSFDLGMAGRLFPAFLKSARVTEKLPFLPELAQLEWRVSEAFHAYDTPAMDPSVLAGFAPEDWERLVFTFRPSVTLARSAWPVVDLWRARRTPIEEFDLELANRPQNVLVHRVGFKVACEALESEEFRVLEGLWAGRTLGAVCDELASTLPEDADLPLDVWFGRWSGLGLFTSANLDPTHGQSFDASHPVLR